MHGCWCLHIFIKISFQCQQYNSLNLLREKIKCLILNFLQIYIFRWLITIIILHILVYKSLFGIQTKTYCACTCTVTPVISLAEHKSGLLVIHMLACIWQKQEVLLFPWAELTSCAWQEHCRLPLTCTLPCRVYFRPHCSKWGYMCLFCGSFFLSVAMWE